MIELRFSSTNVHLDYKVQMDDSPYEQIFAQFMNLKPRGDIQNTWRIVFFLLIRSNMGHFIISSSELAEQILEQMNKKSLFGLKA